MGSNARTPTDLNVFLSDPPGQEDSNIVVVTGHLNPDRTLGDFTVHFNKNPVRKPLMDVNRLDEFRAFMKLVKKSRFCDGIEISPGADVSNILSASNRPLAVVKHDKLFSTRCQSLVYPHDSEMCHCCKRLRNSKRCRSSVKIGGYTRQAGVTSPNADSADDNSVDTMNDHEDELFLDDSIEDGDESLETR